MKLEREEPSPKEEGERETVGESVPESVLVIERERELHWEGEVVGLGEREEEVERHRVGV